MIKEKIEDNILIVTFDNGKSNSITEAMVDQIQEIVTKVNTDAGIKGLILTGEGRTFSSGFNLPMFLSFKDLEETVTFFKKEEEIYINLFMCEKPVISAINGAAVAGGLITAMASDYRVAKNHPKILLGMSEIKIGLGLSIVQSEILRYGFDSDKKYRDLIYFGSLINVSKGLELGIVDELAEEDELIPRAKAIVGQWMDNPGNAFTLLKLGLRKPIADRMRQRLRDDDWEPLFNCMFDKETRAALEAVQKMMGD